MAYQGIKAKIPLGETGLLTDIAPDKAPPDSLIRALNVCYFNGAVQKAPGALQWNATAVSTGIVGAHYWIPNGQVLQDPRFIVLTSDGNIYKGQNRVFGSPINSTIASVLTPNCVFADGGAEQASNPRKLFMFTGGATLPYVLTGDATAAHVIGNPAVDWTSTSTYPKFGLIHRAQLWAFAGQISYASSALDHETFNNSTTGLVNPVYPGEGGELRGGFVFKGRLFCFKDGGYVYSLNDSDPSELNWYWQKVASNFGIAAPNAATEVLDDMVVGNTYGTITSYAATLALGSVAAADLMQINGFDSYMRGYISKSGVPYTHLMYYAEKKLLFMTARSTYSTKNDTVLMLDYGRSGRVRPAIWTKGTPQCLAKYKDIFQIERPMYGGSDGFLYFMDYMDRSEGTASYTGGFQIQHLDFSFIDQSLSATQKHFDFIAVHYMPSSIGNLSCDYYIDGKYIDTVTFTMVQYQRPELDTLALDTDRLSAESPETAVQKIRGTGRTLSAYFYNSGLNQSFQIPAITVYFRPGGDKAQQV
jgi:hypothetical protein